VLLIRLGIVRLDGQPGAEVARVVISAGNDLLSALGYVVFQRREIRA
jgi:hypothetical protein